MEPKIRHIAGLAIALLVIIALSLAACSSLATPAPATPITVLESPTSTNTPAPTVSVATATATSLPSPTATKVVRPPTAAPLPTVGQATPLPSPTPVMYTVQEFDTLFGIAVQFGLTTEELARANGLDERDFLQVGQELVIPVTAGTLPVTVSATPPVTPVITLTVQAGSTVSPTGTMTQTATPAAALAPAVAQATPAPPPPTPTPSGPPLPTVTHPANVNPLTGLTVDDPTTLRRRPLMVRVGNDVGARPQVGLNSADIVYEEITEWWVTRFTAIFLANTPETVGPIRSARLSNVQLVPQYQGALAHSGGSDPVRWEIQQSGLVNLDEFYNPTPYFYRPNEGWQTRLAINLQAARDYMIKKGLDAPVVQQGFVFADTMDGGEPGENIWIYYPRSTCFTEWHYDTASGKYLRWIIGSPLYDANGGQIAAANVIVYFAEHQDTDIVEDSNGATSVRIILNGRGPAWFFRDGKLNKGFWQTDGARTPYFTDEDGQPFPLKPGNSWVEVVPPYYTIGLNSAEEASTNPPKK